MAAVAAELGRRGNGSLRYQFAYMVVWRQDDVAGASEDSAPRCLWTGIPWISAAPGRSPVKPLCNKLGSHTTLKVFEDADHSFHVPARSERKDAQVLGDVLDALVALLDAVISSKPA